MDPNAWLQFIQRALQSTETLSFLIVGMALGGVGGFLLGRWSSSHATLMKHFEEQARREVAEVPTGDRLKPMNASLANMIPGPAIGSTVDPSSDPVSDALWRRIEVYLVGRGIESSTVKRLRSTMSASGKKIIDSDNRQRIMVWSDGSVCHPVAMIWRAGKNPRVLFPDGTETNVANDKLEDISEKI